MLWRETLQVLLSADRVDYRVMPAVGLSPSDIGSLPCAARKGVAAPWAAACDALASLVESRKDRQFRIEVNLSDRFARYQVLDPREGIATLAEWRAYARHAFGAVYGETAHDWDFRIDLVPPGHPSLACAIDNALIETLRALAAQHRSRLVGLRPQFVKLFNRRHFATQRREQFWFAVVEASHVCLGMQAHKQWRAVRNEAAPDGWQAALPGMIRRVRAGLDQPEGGDLYLCGDLTAAAVPAMIEGLPVHATDAAFLRGRAVPVAAQEG